MKVKELIKLLQKTNQEHIVVLSKDEEGNGFSELRNIETDYMFDGEEIGISNLTTLAKKQGYSEEDVMTSGKPCIVLWP